ncbi:helix-turn-helix domain-containing protein [Proteus mirabilis]|uniref:helix-turn-helix domain-containing protein n=1 Tax=Proteus mirabilis TaxID=584 RepID=UPI0020246C41|nr:helix-turn-helix domain-containing protein [Proteus mirabilis]MCL8572646.1 helix-turn-helix domain-containing protein [Proteus mirabilis]
MSVKLSSYVWDGCAHAGLKLTSVAIMARLADFSNDEGICWPSVVTIARQIGAGESTVRTAIKQLEKEGWLTSEKRRKGNRNASNIYQLNVEKLYQSAKKALSQPTKSDVSKSDASGVDPSKFVASNSVPSESSKNRDFDPPAPEGDPSVTSKYDPLINHSSSQNFGESSDQPKNDFLTRYPEAVIYSANFQKWGSADDLKCAKWLFSRKCEVFQEMGLKTPKEPNFTDWANDIRLMTTIDGHTHKEICQFYKRITQDDFWKKNVQCPRTLRAQWDDLTLRLAGKKKITIDSVERDETFRLIWGTGWKPKNKIQELAAIQAKKNGLGRMNEVAGLAAWRGIWQQVAEQVAQEVLL